MTILLTLLIIIFALSGTPLFVVIGATALLCYNVFELESWGIFIEFYRIASVPTLLAIPLFTFAGFLLAESNAPKRLVNFTKALIGWIPGGIAIVSLISCAIFTAFTGASGVTIIALGGLLYPILQKENYSEKFTLGLLTSSGSLGLLFPPSLPIILYGLVSQTNIDDLFLAGIVPGMLLIVILGIYSTKSASVSHVEKTKFSISEIIRTGKEILWEMPLPFIILIGIYGGFFTATEAAAITAFYVFIVEVFVYKDLSLTKQVPKIMVESMTLVGAIIIILGCALGLTNFLIDEQIPMKILDLMRNFITNKFVFLIVLNIFLLIVGCLMDIFSAIVVVVPLIVPIAKEFGVDPVHLGIIFLTNLEIGYLTPPVGLNLFIASSRFKKPIVSLYLASLPFIFLLLIALLLITYFPELSLFLVNFFKN
ncbi:TRAP transporter large permease subunit [bacterium]|nr:TRAP transporter large permease subunit [bacterium]